MAPPRSPGQDTASERRAGVELTSKRVEVARKKAKILELFELGHSADDSCRMAGLSPASWKYYKRTDAKFRDAVDLILAQRAGAKAVGEHLDISFEEFSDRFLGMKLFRHQLQWVDVIEGREPRDLDPGQIYKGGDPDTIIVNTPPGHAKSTTITMNYVTYKIVTNPNFRVVVISKTETMAKKFLQGIKRRLTSPQFKDLIATYAPAEGFEKSAEVWTSTMIYFGHGTSVEKDPNIQVLGIGQQIYGARADLIILDDVEDLQNAHQYEAHLDYVMQDVMTRDAPLLVVGTRVAPVDLYSELLNPNNYDGEESDWTHLTQPAVLQYADDPKDWVTLWPESNIPHPQRPGKQLPNGNWPKWDGERLSKLRRKIKPKTWALVYQQEAVSEDSLFTIEAVNGVRSMRSRGPLRAGEGAVPDEISNFYIVAGLDPATKAGYTAAICLAVDRNTGKRFMLDAFNAQVSPTGLRQLIFDWTEKLGIQEWRVERNGFQAFLTQDREITQYLAARGVRLREHQTGGKNKWDPDWGVSSLEMLFRGHENKTAMLDIPSMGANEAIRTFKEQLVTWYPEHPKGQKTDMVMAFWFAELAARDCIRHLGQRAQSHLDNPFVSENDLAGRVVIDLDEYLREQRMFA